MSKATVGEPAPEFTLPALDGRKVRLADYRGKRVVLFMWGSW
jgi:peroxiredoxin